MPLLDIIYIVISMAVILLTQIALYFFLKKCAYSETERHKQTRLFGTVFVAIIIFVISIYIQNIKIASTEDVSLTCLIFGATIFAVIICEMVIRNLPEESKVFNFIEKMELFSLRDCFYEENIAGNYELKKGSISFKPALLAIIWVNNIFLVILPLFIKLDLLVSHSAIIMALVALNIALFEMYLFLSSKLPKTICQKVKSKLLQTPSEWAKEILNTYGQKTVAYTNTLVATKDETSTTLNDLETIVSDMLQDENMLIANASKNETKAIYYNTINKNFINDKATLIIFEDLPSVKEGKRIIDSIVEEYNKELVVRAIAKTVEENIRIDKTINIYISTMQDLLETNIEYNKIQTIIINNYDKVIQKNSNELYILATTLKKISRNYHYVLLSTITEPLKIATRNILLIENFKEYQINRKNANLMLGMQIIRSELGTIRNHKGNLSDINDLINLAVGTSKFDADNIEITSKKLPMLNDAAKFDAIRANRSVSLTNQELIRITNRIKINENNLFQENSNKKMFFKSDDEKNIIYNLKAYSELNNGHTYLGIVSSNYMLRDYMIDEYVKKQNDNSALDIIVPQTMKNDAKILLGALLIQMLNVPVKEEVVIRRLKEYSEDIVFIEGYNKLNIVTAINFLMEKEFGIKTDVTNYLNEIVDEQGDVEYMLNQNFKTKLPEDIYSKSKVVLSGYVQELTSQKGYEIVQKYIPGQVHLLENKVYRIEDIDDLDIKVSNVQDEYIRLYKQDKKVEISNIRSLESVNETKEYCDITIKKEIEYADLNIQTEGYYEFLDHTTLENAEYIYRKLSKRQIEKNSRKYYNTRVLKLTFKQNIKSKNKDVGEEVRDKIAYTLSFLLNEVLESLLDENTPYIMAKAVVSNKDIIENEEAKIYRPIVDEKIEKNAIVIYIIEDLKISKGLLSTIENELPRIMKIIKSYLNWYEANKDKEEKYIKNININNILAFDEVNNILPNNW